MSETQETFIRRQLYELAPEHGVPTSVVEDLMHLMAEYPSLEGRGRLGDLVAELRKLFDDMGRQGI